MGGPYKGVNAICHWMLSRLRPISGLNPVEAAYRYTYYCIPLLLLPVGVKEQTILHSPR